MSAGFDPNSRRSFIKKSLAVSVAASQPLFLAGLIRASGGGGSTTGETGTGGGEVTKTTETTDHYTTVGISETTLPITDPDPYTTEATTEAQEDGLIYY